MKHLRRKRNTIKIQFIKNRRAQNHAKMHALNTYSRVVKSTCGAYHNGANIPCHQHRLTRSRTILLYFIQFFCSSVQWFNARTHHHTVPFLGSQKDANTSLPAAATVAGDIAQSSVADSQHSHYDLCRVVTVSTRPDAIRQDPTRPYRSCHTASEVSGGHVLTAQLSDWSLAVAASQ